ncbi:MAG: ABC-type transport auxiliary lipoprotein family protein [Pseudomonadota bacterium]
MDTMGHVRSLAQIIVNKDLLNISRAARILLIFALGSVAFGGCALWDKDKVAFHAINYSAPNPSKESMSPDTIMVYRFLTDSSVDTHFLQIADSRSNKRIVTGHSWTQDPSEALTDLVTRDLQYSGLFKKAVDQTSNVSYRYGLEGAIKKFEGIVVDQQGLGLIEAEIKLIDFEPQIIGKGELFKKVYNVKEPSKDTKPESIVEALNKAAKEMSYKIREDIGKSIVR